MKRIYNRKTLLKLLQEKMHSSGYVHATCFPVDPWRIAREEGIEVVVCPLGTVTGMLYSDRWLTRIRLDSNVRSLARRRYTLMHELIHYWFHPPGTYFELPGTETSIYEIQANHGAAEALMPDWAVKEVGTSLGYDVGRLAQTFGVSRKAMEIRLEKLGIRTA